MSRFLSASGALLVVLVVACTSHGGSSAAPGRLLIINARIIDGTGTPAESGAVRVEGDHIAAVGALTAEPNDSVVDAHGLVLAPGFIDNHSHHDGGLLDHPDAKSVVSQGVTTIVVGQDGGSQMPLTKYFATLERTPVAINVASYAGHGTIRAAVMKTDYKRAARPDEVEQMRTLLKQEMDAGALGLSTGLEYDPGIYSTTDELVSLAKVSAASGGRYISHMRSEDRQFWKALHELFVIGQQARLPVQVSHAKLAMRGLWGQGDKLVATLDSARAAGVQVTADIYPYTYWQSDLTVVFPARNFNDHAAAEFALREVSSPEGMLLSEFKPHPAYVGKTIADIAKERGTDPATTLLNLIHESQTYAAAHNTTVDDGDVQGVIGTSMDEHDVERIARWPYASFCSDGELFGRHPRGVGTFPRILGRFVREQHVMPLEEAIRKMTSLAAANVGLVGQGVIAAGHPANLVLFDPATITDRSTPTDPQHLSVGVDRVWVNGALVWKNGEVTGLRPGRVLRRK